MISPEQIQERARRLWASGQVLRAWLKNEPCFPLAVKFRKPSAQEWLSHYAELRAEVARLEAASKAARGSGYTFTIRDSQHQKLGRLRMPENIVFASAEDVAACAGESATFHRFKRIAEALRASEPRLLDWLAGQPFAALNHESAFPRLLAVATYLQAHPRPKRFARELGIAGVDSKFIEDHQTLLSDWLDFLLPEDAVDSTVRGLSNHGFERRFGLRYEDPLIRFRWLDPQRPLGGCVIDATVPLPQFIAYAPHCARVFVTENKISFLTLPECRDSLAIFGGGYAIDRLASVPWLGDKPLHYWGDIDTHGFAILSRLRGYWPHTRSFLMDRDTLVLHQELWSEEPQERRCLHDLSGLDVEEAALYDDLRGDRLGVQIRLEQERVHYACMQKAVMNAATDTRRETVPWDEAR